MIDPRWAGVRRLLVMRPDNIGDVILATPALRAIRDALPQAHVTLLASRAGAQVAPLLPWIDELIVARPVWQDVGGLPFDPEREQGFVSGLAEGEYDAALLLTSFSQSPHPPAMACRLAGIPLRAGESTEGDVTRSLTDTVVTQTSTATHQAERNLALIEALGIPVADRRLALVLPDEAHRAADRLRRELGIEGAYLLLVPHASCTARTYDPGRAAAAAALIAEARGLPVIVTGGPDDRDRTRGLVDALGVHTRDAVGRTDFPAFVALVAGARLVMTNNTSALHVADAFAVPVLTTYSGTELDTQWQARFAPQRLLRRPTTCSPCYRLTCPFDLQCLDIAAEDVAAAGLALLDETR